MTIGSCFGRAQPELKRTLIWGFCCWLLVLTGCRVQTIPPDTLPQTLTPTPTSFPPPPQPSATPISNSPPSIPAIQPVTLPFPPEAWRTHWNETGQFIIQYPKQASFYEGQVPAVDGVLTPTDNTIAIHSINDGNYILSLTTFDLPPGTSLANFIDAHSPCVEVSDATGDPYQLPGRPAGQLFSDTRCGAYNTSYLYFTQGRKGYRFTIESANRYAEVAPHIQPIVASFRSFAPSSEPFAPPLARQPSRLDSLPAIEPENAAQLSPVASLGKGKIAEFALSPTANTLAAATLAGVYLYQMDTLAEQHFIPTSAPALSVAFSPDGTLLAAALADYSVRVWEATGGNLRHMLTSPAERIYNLAFSLDGRHLVAVSGDGVLRGWETNTGQQRYQVSTHPYARLAFSPDGRWLAFGGGKLNRQVQVLEISSGQIVAGLEILPDLLGLAFSPHSQTLALLPSGDRSVSVLLWDFLSGQTRRLPAGDTPHSLAWHPDGTLLAAGGLDRSVTLWDVATGDISRILGQHAGYITALTFSPDGQHLASSDGAGLKIWDVTSGMLKYDLPQFAVTQLVFSAAGRYLAFKRGGTVGLVDLTTGQRRFLPGHSDATVSLAFSPDGKWLATGDYSGLVYIWGMSTGQPVQILDEHTGPVGGLTFSPDNQLLATGGINQDHSYYLWKVSHVVQAGLGKVQPMQSFTDDPGYPLNDLTFTPDGHWLAGGGFDSVVLHHLETGQTRHLTGHDGPILSLAINRAGTRLASGSFDETVVVWDLASGQPLLTLPEHKMGAASLIFSPNGRWLISGDQHDVIRGWEVETGELRQSIKGRGADLALSPDGTLLAFKKTLSSIAVGDIFHAREAAQLMGERPLIFSPDGRLLVVGSDEGVIMLWGVQ